MHTHLLTLLLRVSVTTGFSHFCVLGLDILLTSKARPILLEVNQLPSFHTDSPLDAAVKFPMMREALALASAQPPSDAMLRAAGIDEALPRRQQVLQWRKAYEDHHLDGFTRLYPFEDGTSTKAERVCPSFVPLLCKNPNPQPPTPNPRSPPPFRSTPSLRTLRLACSRKRRCWPCVAPRRWRAGGSARRRQHAKSKATKHESQTMPKYSAPTPTQPRGVVSQQTVKGAVFASAT